jgi:hypothetical protein
MDVARRKFLDRYQQFCFAFEGKEDSELFTVDLSSLKWDEIALDLMLNQE